MGKEPYVYVCVGYSCDFLSLPAGNTMRLSTVISCDLQPGEIVKVIMTCKVG